MPSELSVLREMTTDDVPAVMAVQEPASIAGLSGVFPQDEHPFPRDVLADRWLAEIADADIDCFVILRDDEVAGFAAVQADEVKHFGVAVEEWGSGLATKAHDQLAARMARAGVRRAWLCVYAANPRGRAFWAKHVGGRAYVAVGAVHDVEGRVVVLVPHRGTGVRDEDDAQPGGARAADGVLDAHVRHGAGDHEGVDISRSQDVGQVGGARGPGAPGRSSPRRGRRAVRRDQGPDAPPEGLSRPSARRSRPPRRRRTHGPSPSAP